MLDFRILGPFEVVDGDRQVAVGGPQQRALLAVLVLRRGQAVSSDRLIEELWGGRPPATAAKIIQGYVSQLRKALGDEVLLTRAGGYLLVATADQVDAERFERLVADGRQAGLPTATQPARTPSGSASPRSRLAVAKEMRSPISI